MSNISAGFATWLLQAGLVTFQGGSQYDEGYGVTSEDLSKHVLLNKLICDKQVTIRQVPTKKTLIVILRQVVSS